MLLQALVIGVTSQLVVSIQIDGVDYKPECTIERVILGDRCSTEDGCEVDQGKFCAIRGIPYANASRFERPQPLNETTRKELETWKNEAVHCAQIDPFTGEIIGKENCLVVDLYYPEGWESLKAESRNLIVLLEGMDFDTSLAGFLHPDQTSAKQISSNRYMIAVVHYRTGLFGFMTLQDKLMPANLGLWDQQMAFEFLRNSTSELKVKKDFIALGFGTGAISLHLHMLHPDSTNHFKRVLLSGGNALSPGAVQSDPVNTALTLANLLKCDNSTIESVVKCLQLKKTGELLKPLRNEHSLRFGAVVDGNGSKSDPEIFFISAPPEDLVRKQKINDMEVIIHGYPALAGLNQFARNKDKPSGNDDIEYLSKFFDMYNEKTAKSVAKFAYDQHFKEPGVKEVIEKAPFDFINLLSDFTLGYSVNSLVTSQLKQTKAASVKIESYVLRAAGTEEGEEDDVPSLAKKLKATKGEVPKLPSKFGFALDDMLLFIGSEKAPLYSRDDRVLTSSEVITSNAKNIIEPIMSCLLSTGLCRKNEERLAEDSEVGYTGQRPISQGERGPYRFKQYSGWGSVITLASAMDRLEAKNRELEHEKAKNDNINAAGVSFWVMLVGLIVLAIVSIILVGALVKLVMDRRRATAMTTIEKPARSGAHYGSGMETVTIEEAHHM